MGDKWKEMKPEIEINSDNIFLREREVNRETELRMSRLIPRYIISRWRGTLMHALGETS